MIRVFSPFFPPNPHIYPSLFSFKTSFFFKTTVAAYACMHMCVCVCVCKYWRILDFIVLSYILQSVQLGAGNLIGSEKIWREDRQAQRIWGPVSRSCIIWWSGTSYTITHILRTSACLLGSEHEGELVSLSRMYLYIKPICKHPGGGNYTWWFLHTLTNSL